MDRKKKARSKKGGADPDFNTLSGPVGKDESIEDMLINPYGLKVSPSNNVYIFVNHEGTPKVCKIATQKMTPLYTITCIDILSNATFIIHESKGLFHVADLPQSLFIQTNKTPNTTYTTQVKAFGEDDDDDDDDDKSYTYVERLDILWQCSQDETLVAINKVLWTHIESSMKYAKDHNDIMTYYYKTGFTYDDTDARPTTRPAWGGAKKSSNRVVTTDKAPWSTASLLRCVLSHLFPTRV